MMTILMMMLMLMGMMITFKLHLHFFLCIFAQVYDIESGLFGQRPQTAIGSKYK